MTLKMALNRFEDVYGVKPREVDPVETGGHIGFWEFPVGPRLNTFRVKASTLVQMAQDDFDCEMLERSVYDPEQNPRFVPPAVTKILDTVREAYARELSCAEEDCHDLLLAFLIEELKETVGDEDPVEDALDVLDRVVDDLLAIRDAVAALREMVPCGS